MATTNTHIIKKMMDLFTNRCKPSVNVLYLSASDEDEVERGNKEDKREVTSICTDRIRIC